MRMRVMSAYVRVRAGADHSHDALTELVQCRRRVEAIGADAHLPLDAHALGFEPTPIVRDLSRNLQATLARVIVQPLPDARCVTDPRSAEGTGDRKSVVEGKR